MYRVVFTKDFDDSFKHIEESLYRYWHDYSYSDELFEAIKDKLSVLTEMPELHAAFKGDQRRFFLQFHGIGYVVIYRLIGHEIQLNRITYTRSDYMGS